MIKYERVSPDKEKLQKPWSDDVSYELVETSYFGFSVPEEKIHGHVYHFMHPKLGVCSGGITAFRGIISAARDADCFSWKTYQPMPDDITDATYADGTSVKMIRPLEEFEIRYDDPLSNTRLELTTTAIMPPAGRPGGGHFMQFAHNQGTLVLRGKQYNIDSYFMRDRGWRDPRPESRPKDLDQRKQTAFVMPAFGHDLAFAISGMDGEYLEDQHHYPNFVWANGEIRYIKSRRQRTERDKSNAPVSIEIEITDERDERYRLKGVTEACTPYPYYQPNSEAFVALARWTCEGRTGFGDLQLWG